MERFKGKPAGRVKWERAIKRKIESCILFQTPSYSLKPQNCRQNRQNWWGLMSLQTLSLSRHNDSGSKVGQGELKCGNLPQREGIGDA